MGIGVNMFGWRIYFDELAMWFDMNKEVIDRSRRLCGLSVQHNNITLVFQLQKRMQNRVHHLQRYPGSAQTLFISFPLYLPLR